MQKKKRNGGFTLVELLVVIAVLAVLATVSIVGYTSFVEKAKVSVDVQTLEQLNLVLMANEQSGNGAQNVKDAYNQIYQAGLMPMYTPQGSNLGVCWDSQTNRFVLFQSGANANQGKIVHSTDSKVSNGVEVDVNNDNRFFVYNEPALCQHQWDEGQIVQQPTCTEQGLKTETCKICQTTQNKQVDATGHNWDNGTTTTPPTCQSNGTTTFCCTQCGATETETIAPTGHSEVVDNAVEATCTSTGLTEGKHCSVCNEVLVAQQVIGLKPHTEETIPAIEPTCTTTGLTVGTKCSVCGETLVAQTVVDALGHTESSVVVENSIAPQCTVDGSYDNVIYCTVCNIELSRNTIIVDALGHTEVIDNAVEATCTNTGLTEGKHCSVCNEVLVAQQVVDLKPHTEQSLPAVEPTCTNTGLTVGTKCSVCGETLVEQTVVGALGHTESSVVVENSLAPQCTVDGSYDNVIYCTVCNIELSRNTIIVDALGHTEVIDSAVEATCTSTGLTEGKHCSVCEEVLVAQQVVDKKAHTEETIPAVEPTCTNTGLTVGTKCSVCEEILVAQQVVETVDHNIVDGKCSYCGLQVVTKTFSVYSADAVTVENGTYTTNYASHTSTNSDSMWYALTTNPDAVVYRLNSNVEKMDFSQFFIADELAGDTIYIDLNGCTIAGAITLSASNVTLYVFDSSATKGKVGSINVGTSGQLFVWDVEISNSNNKSGITSKGVDVTMYSGSIHGCYSEMGGGIYAKDASVYMWGGEIYNNVSFGDGGGIFITGTEQEFVMKGGHIYGNRANNGGGMKVKGNVTIDGGTISGNVAQGPNGNGGGIYHFGGTLTINGGTIGGANPYTQTGDAKTMANSAQSQGAEIISEKDIVINNGTVYLHDYDPPYSIIHYGTFSHTGNPFVCQYPYDMYISK
ncbi:MAG: type II secretion system protein [Clostridia bacterium]|nr:type II secretion system protein [Clostridia bacterium]